MKRRFSITDHAEARIRIASDQDAIRRADKLDHNQADPILDRLPACRPRGAVRRVTDILDSLGQGGRER